MRAVRVRRGSRGVLRGRRGRCRDHAEGVRLIPPGTVECGAGRDGIGRDPVGRRRISAGRGGGDCKSLAVFRLRIGRETPAALYVLGAKSEGRFEGEDADADLAFFARALERAIRAWLDLPKI